MSAYIVDKRHILYLVAAALHLGDRGAFRWYYADAWREMKQGDTRRIAEVANMLWCENIISVGHRYSGDRTSAALPGPTNGDFTVLERDVRSEIFHVDPVQVFKSLACFEYQSCEHNGWKTSEAYAFCESLKDDAIRALPGYDDAEWGAPQLTTGVVIIPDSPAPRRKR